MKIDIVKNPKMQGLIIKEIDKMTAMNVLNMEIVVKGVNLEKKDKLDRSK